MSNTKKILIVLLIVIVLCLILFFLNRRNKKSAKNHRRHKKKHPSPPLPDRPTPSGPGEPKEDEVFFVRLSKDAPGILNILLNQKDEKETKNAYLTLVSQMGYSPVTLKDVAEASIDGALWCIGGLALDNSGSRVVAAWPVSKAAAGTPCQGTLTTDKLPSVAVVDKSVAKGIIVKGKKPQPAFRPGNMEIFPWLLPIFDASLADVAYTDILNNKHQWSKLSQ